MSTLISQPLPVCNHGERHIPVVLLVDMSGSMKGAPITELNCGLVEFGDALESDPLALGRADVCIIGFNNDVHTEVGFRPALDYTAPVLAAGGNTALNEAIEVALDTIAQRKDLYRSNGISWYRPWLFVLTDGEATDLHRETAAVTRLRSAIEHNKVVYIPLAVGPYANRKKLQAYYPASTANKLVLSASAADFRSAFQWLSSSISVISRSDPAVCKEVALPTPPSNISVITIGI